jgi:hypothetical protein
MTQPPNFPTAAATPAPMPDLTPLTAAASALPGQSVTFAATLAGLASGMAALQGIATELAALQGVSGLLATAAQIADDLKAQAAAAPLQTASKLVQEAVSPVAGAAQGLQSSVSVLLSGLQPVAAQVAAAASQAPNVLQASGALRTLRALQAASSAPPAQAAAAKAAADQLEQALTQGIASSGPEAGTPALLAAMQALLTALADVRDAYLQLPAPVITALHGLAAYAARAETVASAVEVLVRAWTGVPQPPPILTQGSAASLLGDAMDAAAQLTTMAIFGGLETALGNAASAAQAISPSAVAATGAALSAFGQLGPRVAGDLAGAGVQHAAGSS